jgi:hypothetical protein
VINPDSITAVTEVEHGKSGPATTGSASGRNPDNGGAKGSAPAQPGSTGK